MTEKTEVTPVIFRKEKSGDIVAIFPAEPATHNPYDLEIYAPVGQGWSFNGGYSFCAADYGWYLKAAPASVEEYTPLMNHIKTLKGYKYLKVYRKMQPQFLEDRKDELARIEIKYQLKNHQMYQYDYPKSGSNFAASYARWHGVNPNIVSNERYELLNAVPIVRDHFNSIDAIIERMRKIAPLQNWRLVEESE